MNGNWVRVAKTKPCPICLRPNTDHTSSWCLVARDGTAALCQFVESKKRCGDGGWLHWLGEKPNGATVRHPAKSEPDRHINFDALCAMYRHSANGQLARSASELGVSVKSLERLGCGWDGEALAMPMYDAQHHTIGIRRRWPNGEKKSVHGGHEGCFYSWPLGDEWLFVCEGPTDCAALLTLGFAAIGRPSCSGGTAIVAALAALRHVVIVADSDTPGLRGARLLSEKLKPLVKSVQTIIPPDGSKDVRQWVQRGATREDVLSLVTKDS